MFIFYRYDSSTGTFTVPPGGDGFHYFSVYCTVYYFEYAFFDIQINGETICSAYGETDSSTFSDYVHTTCSVTTYVAEGRIYLLTTWIKYYDSSQEECIPVGCVLSAAVAVCPRGCLPGWRLPRGCLPTGSAED